MSETPLTANTTIAELLATHPIAARVLVSHRMHCVGCDIAPFETVGDACAIYGIAVDDLFADIDRAGAERQENNHGGNIFGGRR